MDQKLSSMMNKLPDFYEKYETGEIIGKGLSSVVKKCICKKSNQIYAVKIMDVSDYMENEGSSVSTLRESPSHELPDENLRSQILHEIEILRRVSGHPNITKLVDHYETESFFFLVFEFCPNGELFDYLNSEVSLSEKKVKFFMKQILSAVIHTRQLDIVHRDLKLENVLLDENMNVKVTDFGFAKRLNRVSRDSYAVTHRLYDVCGTPGYLAPEVLLSGMVMDRSEAIGYGFEVDEWACGVMMYTLLAGFSPFWHRRQLTMIRNICEGKFNFNAPEWKNVTSEAKDLITRFLNTDPFTRIHVEEAIKHPWFGALRSKQHSFDRPCLSTDDDTRVTKFNARFCFHTVLNVVQFVIRIKKLKDTPQPLSISIASSNPYQIRPFQKMVDSMAFQVYSHWVKKKGFAQNRTALYEHGPRREHKIKFLKQQMKKTSLSEPMPIPVIE